MDDKKPGRAGSRKTNFEIVKQPDLKSTALTAKQNFRIISVAYDASLLKTREILLVRAGYQVFSFLKISEVLNACRATSFDLIMVGHSIPLEERKKLVKELRVICDTPVLALLRPNEPRLAGADHCLDSAENPALLLEKVREIFGQSAKG